jgi:lambda repressor-like predicted transcriptional regulator
MKQNLLSPTARRSRTTAARRERILAKFKRSGLSAYGFARQHSLPYSTLIQWLKRSSPVPKDISFTEVELPAPPPEPLTLELGPHARLRLTAASQMPLAVQLIKLLQA